MHGKKVGESTLHVEFYQKEVKQEQTVKGFTNLYVKNFPHPNFEESHLYVGILVF